MDAMTSEDYESVARAGRVLHERGWRTIFSLNEMTDAWRSLVVDVEAGYDQMIDEYADELSCRDWIAQAWPMLTGRVRAARKPELDDLDSRFRVATIEDTSGRLVSASVWMRSDGWWWRRLPIKRRGEFARDLDV